MLQNEAEYSSDAHSVKVFDKQAHYVVRVAIAFVEDLSCRSVLKLLFDVSCIDWVFIRIPVFFYITI